MANRKLFIGVIVLVLTMIAGLDSAFAQEMIGVETTFTVNATTRVPGNFSIGLQGMTQPRFLQLGYTGWSLDYMERKRVVNSQADGSEESPRKVRGVLYSGFLGLGLTNFLGLYGGGGLGVAWEGIPDVGYRTSLAWKLDGGVMLGLSRSWYLKAGLTHGSIRGTGFAFGFGFRDEITRKR